MRGQQNPQVSRWAFTAPESRVPTHHLLRTIWVLTDQGLPALSPQSDRVYADTNQPRRGRPLPGAPGQGNAVSNEQAGRRLPETPPNPPH